MIRLWTELTAPKYFIRVDEEDNEILIHIVDEKGSHIRNGNICTISEKGIYHCMGIDKEAAKSLGIPLDANGSVFTTGVN